MNPGNFVDFPGEHWYGWRLRGRHLVSPDGVRITRERLVGLLWRDQLELQRAGYRSRIAAENCRRKNGARPLVKVIVVDLADVRVRGTVAG